MSEFTENVLTYLYAAAGLAIVIRYDPKRLLASKLATADGRLFGFPRWLFFTWIPLPVYYGVMRGSTVDTLIALGFVLVVGWLLTRAYAVRR